MTRFDAKQAPRSPEHVGELACGLTECTRWRQQSAYHGAPPNKKISLASNQKTGGCNLAFPQQQRRAASG